MKEKTCRLTGKTFVISDEEADLNNFFGMRAAGLCPEERYRSLLLFSPQKHFFLRSCDATGEQLFSIYSPTAPFPVYSQQAWLAPDWDPLQYGRTFDFKRLFVEQLLELWRAVPRAAAYSSGAADSRVVHGVREAERCFLVFDSSSIQDCLYSDELKNSLACVDCHHLEDCAWCYECLVSAGCERLCFGEFCTGCRNSWFLSQCRDCSDCLFCCNLQGKRFHIFNRPVTEEDFTAALRELSLHARPLLELARNRFADFCASTLVPHISESESREVTGNYLRRCERMRNAFECEDCQDVINGHNLRNVHTAIDCVLCSDAELLSQSIGIFNGSRVLSCVNCDSVENAAYSSDCEDCADIFGCVSLRHRRYCILNKQYSPDEYQQVYSGIVEHLTKRNLWGAPLPLNFSGHAYNYSAANEYMPLTKIPAKMMGFNWDESDVAIRPSDLIGFSQLEPEEIYSEVPEQLGEIESERIQSIVYLCEVSGKPFQLTADEISFYEQMNLPPPARCYRQRHLERIARLTPHALTIRSCSLSGEELLTAVPLRWKQPLAEAGLVFGQSERTSV
jgi:hypothetical protein